MDLTRALRLAPWRTIASSTRSTPNLLRRAITTTTPTPIRSTEPASAQQPSRKPSPGRSSGLADLGKKLVEETKATSILGSDAAGGSSSPLREHYAPETIPWHHLYIFSTRHNCHLTLCGQHTNAKGKVTNPRDPIISISSGSLGFRKSNRGSYDAAYQLGAYLMGRIQQQGLLTQINKLELIFRGYGPGREAIQKIFLGVEGQALRPRVKKVVDATRLKIGGNRARAPRRL